jgi:predicted RNA-binding protein YlxR (DUF448 family)/ribosomal protein L30E
MAHKRDNQNQREPRPEGTARTCVGSRQRRAPEELVRFVLAPPGFADLALTGPAPLREGEHALMLDLSGKAPGRGAWLSPDPESVKRALQKGGFQRALQVRLRLPSPELLTQTLAEALGLRLRQRLALARRAGALVVGEGQVSTALKQDQGKALLLARDLSPGGRKKQEANAGRKGLPVVVAPLDGGELGGCIGRDYAGIILICAEPFAEDLQRLSLQLNALCASSQIRRGADHNGSTRPGTELDSRG